MVEAKCTRLVLFAKLNHDFKGMAMRPNLNVRRLLMATGIVIASIVFLALVILSPLALRAVASPFGLNWSNLSDVGQTYGAVSALITALALGGVVISLLYQARDVSATRSQAIRTFQFELLRMELEDADLMWASGAPWGTTAPADYRRLRQHIFVHMWLSFRESQFLLNEMSSGSVRSAAKEIFNGEAAREYWESFGDWRLTSNEGRRLQFLHIIDEEYREAIKSSPSAVSGKAIKDQETKSKPARNKHLDALPKGSVSYIAAAAAGLLTGYLIRRQR
jgi:Family of unknown function (DUF6082)